MPTISPDRLRAILEDLYALDPSLRAQGDDLAKIVTELMAARPDVSVDAQFVASLRRNLDQRAASSTPQPSFLRFIPTFMQKPLTIILPLSAVAVIAIVILVTAVNPSALRPPTSAPSDTPNPGPLAAGVIVTRAGANAFGSLASAEGSSNSAEPLGLGYSGRSISGAGAGGGGAGVAMPASTMPPTAGSDAKMSESAMIVSPDFAYERMRYVYKGEELSLEPSAAVYRRVKRPFSGADIASVLRGTTAGTLDLGRFDNAQLQQFTVVQPGEFGYQISVDLTEGFVNISENYAVWPHPESACRDEACTERLRVTPQDIPEDAALIAIADAFLNDHGIRKDTYGAPVVDRRWGIAQMFLRDGAESDAAMRIAYAPEVVSIIYPIRLDGVTVYDQSAFPYGISVSVDVRNKRVRSLWNLTPQAYESSAYDLVTDRAQILDTVSRGDVYAAPFGSDPNEKVVDIEIGAPERVLMQAYRVREDGMGEEMLVPALRFPILSGEDIVRSGRDAVIVPLVKDLIMPQIYLMKGSGGSGTSPAMPVSTDPGATPPPATEPALQ